MIAAKEGLYAIIQEDSGNLLGERMFITKLEHDEDGQELEYDFIAQSGGAFNTRMVDGVGVPAHSNGGAGSHEFAGVIDMSGFVKLNDEKENEKGKKCKCDCSNKCKKKGKKKTEKEKKKCDKCKKECNECKSSKKDKEEKERKWAVQAGDAKGLHEAKFSISINDKLIAIGLQGHNLFMGAVNAFDADRGGQIVLYAPKSLS